MKPTEKEEKTMKIITVCGSLRFQREMMERSEKLELEGNCVLSPVYPAREGKDAYTEAEISMLNQMHREKIKLSDAIFVVNVGGYLGDSTKNEIEFAKSLGKEILYDTEVLE